MEKVVCTYVVENWVNDNQKNFMIRYIHTYIYIYNYIHDIFIINLKG